jgi:hypothetical protein
MMCRIMLFGPPGAAPRRAGPAHKYVSRDGRIVVVQFPALAARTDHITIYNNREATRRFEPSAADGGSARRTLSAALWQAIEALRVEWCRNPPRSVQPYYYDIGLECSKFRARRVLLPKEMLPPPLAILLETLLEPR